MSISPALLPPWNTNCAKILCDTTVTQNKICYQWMIDRECLTSRMKGESIDSSKFVVNAFGKRKFQFKLYPKGVAEANEGYASIYFILDNSDTFDNPEFYVKNKYTILNTKGQECHNINCPTARYKLGSYSLGIKHFSKLDSLLEKANVLLHDDKITIMCEVIVFSDDVTICSNESNRKQFKVPESKLIQDFGNLFDKAEFTDLTLAVGDRELHAHKAILAARSNVFAAMFKHALEESKLNRVTITDIDYEVAKEMLNFIYTDTSPNIKEMAFDLLVAADKYALEKLKVMCEEVLYQNICTETAVDTLILAERHNADQLRTYTKDFIKTHVQEVMEYEGWEKMLERSIAG